MNSDLVIKFWNELSLVIVKTFTREKDIKEI